MPLSGIAIVLIAASACTVDSPPSAVFEEFCLRGEFDLSARMQGRNPAADEWYPATWCVVSSPESERVHFSASGRSNPDMEGAFAVSYLPPDRVRLVNAQQPPDVEFRGTLASEEARSIRRIDPERLIAELGENPDWVVAEHEGEWLEVRWPGSFGVASVQISGGRLHAVRAAADLPLRGRVPVIWTWTWPPERPDGVLELQVDGEPMFRAMGERRTLPADEADTRWDPSGGQVPRGVPGAAWPAAVSMNVETVAEGVHVVQGVRTGFHHLVVETRDGLVVVDAPAGWVEVHRLPPSDLLPGLGVSGLSERFVDYLRSQWPGAPIRAVVLTHAHDDHSGGARAFAAANAEVYAPLEVAGFLETALNRTGNPDDRLSGTGQRVRVIGVEGRVVLPDPERPIELLAMGANPHVDAALGVHVPSAQVFFQSDLHVPRSTAVAPRADRLETDCWFAGWATRSLPRETMVHNSHGTVSVSVGDIAAYLDHEGCRNLSD